MKVKTYTITSPKLDGPLVFDRIESGTNVVKMFALRYLMDRFPGHFDMEDLDEFVVTAEDVMEGTNTCE